MKSVSEACLSTVTVFFILKCFYFVDRLGGCQRMCDVFRLLLPESSLLTDASCITTWSHNQLQAQLICCSVFIYDQWRIESNICFHAEQKCSLHDHVRWKKSHMMKDKHDWEGFLLSLCLYYMLGWNWQLVKMMMSNCGCCISKIQF